MVGWFGFYYWPYPKKPIQMSTKKFRIFYEVALGVICFRWYQAIASESDKNVSPIHDQQV